LKVLIYYRNVTDSTTVRQKVECSILHVFKDSSTREFVNNNQLGFQLPF
jgi:hypothetical protein